MTDIKRDRDSDYYGEAMVAQRVECGGPRLLNLGRDVFIPTS